MIIEDPYERKSAREQVGLDIYRHHQEHQDDPRARRNLGVIFLVFTVPAREETWGHRTCRFTGGWWSVARIPRSFSFPSTPSISTSNL